MMRRVFTIKHIDETPARVEAITVQPEEYLLSTEITATRDGQVKYAGNTYPNIETMLSAWGLTKTEDDR